MKGGRLQAFSFCPSCSNLRAVRIGTITYSSDSTRIQGACSSCGAPIDVIGQRHLGLKIGRDKRQLN